jgi:hypothetical protein
LTCNKYKDPNTGKYTLAQGPACQVFLNWAKAEFTARNKQAVPQSKPEPSKEPKCEIRKYPDTLEPYK